MFQSLQYLRTFAPLQTQVLQNHVAVVCKVYFLRCEDEQSHENRKGERVSFRNSCHYSSMFAKYSLKSLCSYRYSHFLSALRESPDYCRRSVIVSKESIENVTLLKCVLLILFFQCTSDIMAFCVHAWKRGFDPSFLVDQDFES